MSTTSKLNAFLGSTSVITLRTGTSATVTNGSMVLLNERFEQYRMREFFSVPYPLRLEQQKQNDPAEDASFEKIVAVKEEIRTERKRAMSKLRTVGIFFFALLVCLVVLFAERTNDNEIPLRTSTTSDEKDRRKDGDGPLHFVLVVLDSVGKGDLFASEDRMGYSTPAFNKLASQGVVLKNFYVQPESSPTRSALLTGKYPFKTGMQEQLVSGTTAHIPLNVPTLPELLKASKTYETHLIGGWGLGGASVDYTPTYRGFDTFYGFLGSEIDYVNKTRGRGVDFWDEVAGDTKYARAAWGAKGNYSTLQFSQRTRDVLEDYVKRRPSQKDQELNPMFLMVSHQAMGNPLSSSHPEQSNRCKKASKARKKYCSMMVAVDNAMGDLYSTLLRLNLWSRTMVVVASDSGSMVPLRGYDSQDNEPIRPGSVGSNYPYRGSKTTLFEGGVRGVAMISGGALQPEVRGKVYDGLAHAVDVPVFILSAVFNNLRLTSRGESKLKTSLEEMDGIPLVDLLLPAAVDLPLGKKESPNSYFLRHFRVPRTEIPLNIASSGIDFTAIRFGRWKLIIGSSQIYRSGDGWWPSSAEGDPQLPKPDRNRLFTPYKLFDLIADPLEKVNMRNFSEVIKEGRARIRALVKSGGYQEPQFNFFNPLSLPILHNGAWAPFLDGSSFLKSSDRVIVKSLSTEDTRTVLVKA